jgi:hypothetical protein
MPDTPSVVPFIFLALVVVLNLMFAAYVLV